MKNKVLKIYNANIHPGEKATLALPLPVQYSCSPMYMPLKIIHGKVKGPVLLIFSMLDGVEFNGLAIINQIFDQIEAKNVLGTLITVPVLNVYGLTHYPKTSPSGVSISNSFPGDPKGNFSERIAHVFTQEILKLADYCIELQTGSLNHETLPQIYCSFDDAFLKKLAKNFQAPVVTEVEISDSELRKTTDDLNIPLLVYEAGEAMRFDQIAIQTGVNGIQNVMKDLEMLEGVPVTDVIPMFSKNEDWLVSPSSGILSTEVTLGQKIQSGEKIGKLSDPFSGEDGTIIKSNLNGIVVGINRSPLIQEGESIFKIASFIDNKKAENSLEKWDDLQSDILD